MKEQSYSEPSPEQIYEIMAGMDEVNRQMAEEIERKAPMCHMKKMFLDESDTTDGYYEQWWECSVCGHTKDINESRPQICEQKEASE